MSCSGFGMLLRGIGLRYYLGRVCLWPWVENEVEVCSDSCSDQDLGWVAIWGDL